MITINLLLLILALVCAVVGSFNWTFGPKTPNWVALALAFWFASMLVRG